jgi:HK97 family phage portal protein
MRHAIGKALQRLNSIKANAKAAVTLPRLDAIGSGGYIGNTRSMPSGARELTEHFRGWAYAAVRVIATRVAGQAIKVGLRRKGPVKEKAAAANAEALDSHRLLDALADPSELHTQWSLLFCTVASMELTGRALWWATVEDGQDRLFHLPTHWIESTNRKRTVWNIRPDGATQSYPIPGEQVLHVAYPDPSDPLGCIAPLARIIDAVLADENIGTAQRAAFENGIFPKIVLSAGRMPDDPLSGAKGERPVLEAWQRRELINAIKNVYRGSLAADEPFILDGLIENITKLSNTVAEMDFLNSAKLTKSKVLQGFGVSPILLGEVEGANRASATVADDIFVSNKINPLLIMLGQGMTEWLGPIYAGPNEKLTVWFEPAVANDPELTLKRWEAAAKLGYVTPNEFRRTLLGLPDIDGGDEPHEPLAPMGKELNPYTLEELSL